MLLVTSLGTDMLVTHVQCLGNTCTGDTSQVETCTVVQGTRASITDSKRGRTHLIIILLSKPQPNLNTRLGLTI